MKKNLLLVLFSAAAFVLTGCTTMEADDTTETWGDDLTPAEIISVMPITVDLASTPAAQPTAIRKMNAVTDEAIKVEWRIPKLLFGLFPIEAPWEIYGQNAEGDWDVLPASVTRDEVEDSVTGQIDFRFTAVIFRNVIFLEGNMLATLKVSLPDHNDGVLGESIVTFMVAPDKDLRVTLVEASADAPSVLFGEYSQLSNTDPNWNGWVLENNLIFEDLQGFAGGVDLPTANILSSQLPAFSPIKFTIETDFSGSNWEFDTPVVVHESNTSFCKVTNVSDELTEADGALWRFKYSFEDLPLDKSSFEAGGLFDYNDLVFYVDVLE